MKCNDCLVETINDDKEYYCPDCGLVFGQMFDDSRFENDVLVKHKDKKIGSVTTGRMRKLARTYGYTPQERATNTGLFYCNIVASELSMGPEAKEILLGYYVKLRNTAKFSTKMKLEDRAAALAYIVIREFNIAYTLQEISAILEIPSKRLSKLARGFARHLNLSHVFSNINVVSLLEKNCRKLGKSGKYIGETISIFQYLQSIEFVQPTTSYLAGIIYLVETTQGSKTITQKNIAETLGITHLTVRLQYKKILIKLNLPNTFGLSIDDIVAGIR